MAQKDKKPEQAPSQGLSQVIDAIPVEEIANLVDSLGPKDPDKGKWHYGDAEGQPGDMHYGDAEGQAGELHYGMQIKGADLYAAIAERTGDLTVYATDGSMTGVKQMLSGIQTGLAIEAGPSVTAAPAANISVQNKPPELK